MQDTHGLRSPRSPMAQCSSDSMPRSSSVSSGGWASLRSDASNITASSSSMLAFANTLVDDASTSSATRKCTLCIKKLCVSVWGVLSVVCVIMCPVGNCRTRRSEVQQIPIKNDTFWNGRQHQRITHQICHDRSEHFKFGPSNQFDRV